MAQLVAERTCRPGPNHHPSARGPPLCASLQVEGSPTVVKKGLKKEEAEEIKKKLEAGGWGLALLDG